MNSNKGAIPKVHKSKNQTLNKSYRLRNSQHEDSTTPQTSTASAYFRVSCEMINKMFDMH